MKHLSFYSEQKSIKVITHARLYSWLVMEIEPGLRFTMVHFPLHYLAFGKTEMVELFLFLLSNRGWKK